MKIEDALKEAARRSGVAEDIVNKNFAVLKKIGGDVWHFDEELSPGTEEAFIQRQMEIKATADAEFATNPEGSVAKAFLYLAVRKAKLQ